MFTSMAKDKIMLKELGADLFSNWDTDVGNEKKKQKDYTYIYIWVDDDVSLFLF